MRELDHPASSRARGRDHLEASRHLPEPLRATEPEVPWREIASIGNVLRHAYHRIDDEVIYVIVTRQLGPLEATIRRLLDRLDAEESAEAGQRGFDNEGELKA